MWRRVRVSVLIIFFSNCNEIQQEQENFTNRLPPGRRLLYVSDHAPAFASPQLLAFCQQYLNLALEKEEMLGAFKGIYIDGDGSIAATWPLT